MLKQELVSFEIEQGASVKEVSKKYLKEVDPYLKLFTYLKFKNVSGFKSGLYHVSKSMTSTKLSRNFLVKEKDRSKRD